MNSKEAENAIVAWQITRWWNGAFSFSIIKLQEKKNNLTNNPHLHNKIR